MLGTRGPHLMWTVTQNKATASHCITTCKCFYFSGLSRCIPKQLWEHPGLYNSYISKTMMKILQMFWDSLHSALSQNIHVTTWMVKISTIANAWWGFPSLEHTWISTQHTKCTLFVDGHKCTRILCIHFHTYKHTVLHMSQKSFLHVLRPTKLKKWGAERVANRWPAEKEGNSDKLCMCVYCAICACQDEGWRRCTVSEHLLRDHLRDPVVIDQLIGLYHV